WTWDLEHHSGRMWLAPLPGQCFLTAQDPTCPPLHQWLLARARRGELVKGVDLSSGLHRSLEFRSGQWGYLDRGGWKPLGGAPWRVTLDMEALKELGYSESAFYSAQFTFNQARALLRSSNPFAPLLDDLEPLELPTGSDGLVDGNHLQF